jgi:hypothetical protein
MPSIPVLAVPFVLFDVADSSRVFLLRIKTSAKSSFYLEGAFSFGGGT